MKTTTTTAMDASPAPMAVADSWPASRRTVRRVIVVLTVVCLLLTGGVAQAAWSLMGTGTVGASAGSLAAPATVTASAAGSTVTVTWDAAVGAPAVASYVISRSPAGGTCLVAATTSCTEFAVPDGSYTYTVSTVAGTNWSSTGTTSNSVTVTTGPPPPSTATTFSVTAGTDVSKTKKGPGTWDPAVKVAVTDDLGASVKDVTIDATWSGSDGSSGTAQCSVGSGSGTCTLEAPTGMAVSVSSVTFTVTGGSHATLTYTPGTTTFVVSPAL